MAGIFNGIERTFAPKFVIDRQKNEVLDFNGKPIPALSDTPPPSDEPAAAASATPMQTGQPLSNAPSTPQDITPGLRQPPTPPATIAGSTYDYKNTAFEPKGSTYSPEEAGATIGGGNNLVNSWIVDARKNDERNELIAKIGAEYGNKLQGEIAGMDAEQAQSYLRDQELLGPKIGADKYWHQGAPYHKHQAWNALPDHWPSYKKEEAIRIIQGLPKDDNRFLPDPNAGAFDKAMNTAKRGGGR